MSVLVALQVGGAEFTSTATWEQAPASWAATATETFAASATFDQVAASWSSTATESFDTTATFLQAAATWDGVASEAFSATASFVQAAAAWDANAAEAFVASATWDQTASWTTDATNTPGPTTFTGAWEQAQSWQAQAEAPVTTGPPHGAALVTGPAVPRRQRVSLNAAFSQQPASWAADVLVVEDDDWLLLFDEPALIGAT